MDRPVLSNRNVYPEAQPEGWQKGRGDKPGMTLRQHYAGLALQGLLADPQTGRDGAEVEDIVRMAVRAADALLLELTK